MVQVVGGAEKKFAHENGAENSASDHAVVNSGPLTSCTQFHVVSAVTSCTTTALVTPGDQVASWLPRAQTAELACAADGKAVPRTIPNSATTTSRKRDS